MRGMIPSNITINWSSSAGTTDGTAGTTIEFSLAELDTYRHRLFANFALTVLFNAYGLFMILKHSPREMATYRWYLLNILIWSFALDVCIALLFQPYPLLPIFGYCTLGIIIQFSDNILISGYGIFIFTAEVTISCCGSIILALFYRLTVLCNSDSFFVRAFNSWWGIALMVLQGAIVYVYAAFFCVQVFSAIHPRLPIVRQKYYADHPGIRAILDSDILCILTTMDVPNIQLGLFYNCLLLVFGLCFSFGTIFVVLFTLWQRRTLLSANTFRLHRQFIVAIIVQLIVPMGTMLVPVTGIAVCLFFRLSYPRAFDDILFLVCSSHSTLNVLVMVACTRPYRDAAKAHLLWPLRLLCPKLAAKMNKNDKPKSTQPALTTRWQQLLQQNVVVPIKKGEIERRFS